MINMKALLTLLASGLLVSSLAAADADGKTEIKAAAKKLADQSGYSWTTTSKSEGGGGGGGNFRMGPTEGKTEKDGWTHTSATFGDNKIETFLKGGKFATKRQDEWQTAEDLEGDDRGAFMVRRLKAFKAPAVEAGELLDKVKEVKQGEGGVYAGDLTPEAAKALMTRGRPGAEGPADAKGTAKFWIKDGTLTKFEYNLQGTVIRPDNNEEIKSNRTTTTEFKEVGSTKIAVPPEVKKKLS